MKIVRAKSCRLIITRRADRTRTTECYGYDAAGNEVWHLRGPAANGAFAGVKFAGHPAKIIRVNLRKLADKNS